MLMPPLQTLGWCHGMQNTTCFISFLHNTQFFFLIYIKDLKKQRYRQDQRILGAEALVWAQYSLSWMCCSRKRDLFAFVILMYSVDWNNSWLPYKRPHRESDLQHKTIRNHGELPCNVPGNDPCSTVQQSLDRTDLSLDKSFTCTHMSVVSAGIFKTRIKHIPYV